jgi:LCP family protein required for cell wall assembly
LANINYKLKNKMKFYQKKWFKIVVIIGVVLFLGGGIFAWKTGSILNKISGGGLLQSIVQNIPGVSNELKSEENGRINVLLLGMRGENVVGGGTLADTIMVASIIPAENKASLISIPRDLYVDNPGWANKSKINAVYAAGEENGKKQGLADMEKVVGEVTGLPIHYGASINFEGFKQLIDAIGGVEITLDKPFEESMQFNEAHVCDGNVFTVPTGEFENKYHKTYDSKGKVIKEKIVKSYPLCTNPNTECGGNFKLPAGKQTLSGEKALCYVRSRTTSSDFERAKRQQIILQLVKDKMLSAGTLTDFSKVNSMLNVLGDNVRSDMQIWEMQKFYDIYKDLGDLQIYQRVLENSDEGFLYNPTDMPKEVGYILLPIGGNYEQIHQMAQNIFTLPAQSDIKPK